jgi:hypothetical protein
VADKPSEHGVVLFLLARRSFTGALVKTPRNIEDLQKDPYSSPPLRRNEKLPLIHELSAFYGLRVDQSRIWPFCRKALRFVRNHETAQKGQTAQKPRLKHSLRSPLTKLYFYARKEKIDVGVVFTSTP